MLFLSLITFVPHQNDDWLAEHGALNSYEMNLCGHNLLRNGNNKFYLLTADNLWLPMANKYIWKLEILFIRENRTEKWLIECSKRISNTLL